MDKSNLYQLDGREPVAQAIPFGLQHVLAMFLREAGYTVEQVKKE